MIATMIHSNAEFAMELEAAITDDRNAWEIRWIYPLEVTIAT